MNEIYESNQEDDVSYVYAVEEQDLCDLVNLFNSQSINSAPTANHFLTDKIYIW